ncbi:MAG: ABC transporter ATP-binding protein [Gracilibacteraceae bacterium]|jgi:ABC-2 type transport system ATP-binding protein|nr:ABC transporter ATP-binding protein [Gracilibacteraceae bacterium]
MNNAIEARGLCKKYGSFTLKDVSFDLPQGYIMGFIGPNGSGKTTTIKIILKMIQGDAGAIRLFGADSAAAGNDRIGVVMDTPLYVDDWTAAGVGRALAPFYSRWDAGSFADYLRRFGLEPQKKVKELSRGMKVKLQIAAALSHEAKLLILDEPTSGLDPVARDEICDLLHEFVADENHSVLFSTHITSDIEKTADYITFILSGGISFTGPKDALLEKYVRVAGGPGDLTAEQKRLVVGLRAHETGFEGMAETANIGKLPGNVVAEKISLDEIVIFMNREAKSNG